MPSKPRGNPKRLGRQTTKQTPVPGPAQGSMPSMLKNAKNTHIKGGSFNITTTFNTANEPTLDVLHKRVAPNAILNAGGRADEVRCHPGTREEVINRIEKWSDGRDGQTAPIFWLSGPAGAGKSAIMQTIAERRKQQGAPHANFFFFRADTSRSHASPLIATLLHQIILLYPPLRDTVANVLSDNPLIFDSVLGDQLEQLIVAPLFTVQQSCSDYRPLILLIDGLDECDSERKRIQQQILDAFDKILIEDACPFRLLVASRDESQIRAAFNKLSSQCLHLYLDDQYSPESDIRVFVNAQFEQIRKTHPLAHTLDATWPSVEDVNYIIDKTSGQFIYAATVMRFLSDSAASPMLSLERVQGAAQLATKSPFSHLDAIYSYILSQADDQETLRDILRAQALIREIGEVERCYFGSSASGSVPKPPVTPLFSFTSGSNPLPSTFSFAPAQPSTFDSAQSPIFGSGSAQPSASWPEPPTSSPFSASHVWSTLISTFDFAPAQPSAFDSAPQPFIFGSGSAQPFFYPMSEPSPQPAALSSTSAPHARPTSPSVLLMEFLKLFHSRYTKATILSCLADLTSIAQFKVETQQLLFYHASFSDYLLDQSRSGLYFVDIAESIYRILPRVWDLIDNGETDQTWLWFAVFGTSKLQKLPPSSMSALASAEDVWLHFKADHGLYFRSLSNLCVCDDDVINFRSILRQWIISDKFDGFKQKFDDIKNIRFGRRYYEMARADCYHSPDGEMDAALRPETDSDRQELALWLGELLHCVYRADHYNPEQDRCNPKTFFKRLLKDWISWAVRNDISCDNLADLPDAQRYIRRSIAQRGPAQGSRIGRRKK